MWHGKLNFYDPKKKIKAHFNSEFTLNWMIMPSVVSKQRAFITSLLGNYPHL